MDECVAVAVAEAVAVAVTEAVAEADQSIHDQSIHERGPCLLFSQFTCSHSGECLLFTQLRCSIFTQLRCSIFAQLRCSIISQLRSSTFTQLGMFSVHRSGRTDFRTDFRQIGLFPGGPRSVPGRFWHRRLALPRGSRPVSGNFFRLFSEVFRKVF